MVFTMGSTEKKVRALGLCSGGLDSILSALVLRQQAIEVTWVTFETPFFSAAKARNAARITGIPLTVRPITARYLAMLRNPACGYGKHMNPCLDCHALMFRLAGELMQAGGYDFLFSGEVLGQRPMSQTRPSLRYVEKQSGFDGYILRPLSAQRLPETIPERLGLVRRENLLGLAGRSRKPQIKLADEFGIIEYPAPAGGCLLTDKGYATRLRDLFDHRTHCSEAELELLKYGRHLRLVSGAKIIVGRTQKDNENIMKHRDPVRDTLLKVRHIPGPTVLIAGGAAREDLLLAAGICVHYSKARGEGPAEVQVVTRTGREILQVSGVAPEAFQEFML